MAISERLPGLKPGSPGRNLLVGLFLLPFYLAGLLFYIPIAVATNRHGLADRLTNSPLSRLPGLNGGGWTAGVATAGYIFLIIVLLGAAGPADTPDATGSAPLTTTTSPSAPAASSSNPTTPPTTVATTATEQPSTATPTSTRGGTPTTTSTTATTASPTPTTTTTTTTIATTSTTSTPSQAAQTSWNVTVVEVVDGDTFTVRFPDGHTEDVRLLGVDTPEVHVENAPAEFEDIPSTASGTDWLRDWGHKASEYARNQLGSETIRIRIDEQADRRGSYGRLLVYAYDDGSLFNSKLLRQGYARLCESSFSKRASFTSLEDTAQQDDVGLWGYSSSSTPTTTTLSSSSSGSANAVTVAAVHADASGNDHENLNGEYITFKNTGSSAVDLSGWTIRDEADHTYVVPGGVTLASGETVTLYTGSGSNTDSELYWGADGTVWNNDGGHDQRRDGFRKCRTAARIRWLS